MVTWLITVPPRVVPGVPKGGKSLFHSSPLTLSSLPTRILSSAGALWLSLIGSSFSSLTLPETFHFPSVSSYFFSLINFRAVVLNRKED